MSISIGFNPVATKSEKCKTIFSTTGDNLSNSILSSKFFTSNPNSVSPSILRRRWKNNVSGSSFLPAIRIKSLAIALNETSVWGAFF